MGKIGKKSKGPQRLQDFRDFKSGSKDFKGTNQKFTEFMVIVDDFAKDFKSVLQDFKLVVDPL